MKESPEYVDEPMLRQDVNWGFLQQAYEDTPIAILGNAWEVWWAFIERRERGVT